MTDTLEETAQKIADRGREALIARLRPAFEEAAAAHSDVLDLGPEQLDAMVTRAVDRADGLQWRRALASVATEELGISLSEALAHPAVARAQELAGAPSYEESLAQLGPLSGAGTKTAAAAETAAEASQDEAGEDEAVEADEDEEAPELQTDEPDVEAADEADETPPPQTEARSGDAPGEDVEIEAAGTLDPAPPSAEMVGSVAPATDEHELGGADEAQDEFEAEDDDAYADESELPEGTAEYDVVAGYGVEPGAYGIEDDYDEDDGALRVAVIHLGGIANLAPAERNIELQMSDEGLDIVRGSGEILGRLDWDQVKALEVPAPRGRRRMRRAATTHLVVRTARGDASFEVPEVTAPELEKHLAPIVARHVRNR